MRRSGTTAWNVTHPAQSRQPAEEAGIAHDTLAQFLDQCVKGGDVALLLHFFRRDATLLRIHHFGVTDSDTLKLACPPLCGVVHKPGSSCFCF